jgi:hypothetical protein
MMASNSLPAHSLVEAFLYFRVTPCTICRTDRLDPGEPVTVDGCSEIVVVAGCRNCGGSDAFRFSIPVLPPRIEKSDPISSTQAITLGSKPSELIDLVQWVTLHQILIEQCSSTPDPAEARWLKIRAGQCLDEALKFIDDGATSQDAAFQESSIRALADHPERYARSRLIDLRNNLPTDEAFGDVSLADLTKRPWWKLW